MDYEVGDIVKLKKQHPCGSKEWSSHQIMIPRKQVEKNTRGLRKKGAGL